MSEVFHALLLAVVVAAGPSPADVLREALGALRERHVLGAADVEQAVASLGNSATLDAAHAAIEERLVALGDRATRWLASERWTSLQQEWSSARTRTGLLEVLSLDVDERDGSLVVVTPVPGSPASAAGLRPGDVVVSVDGQPARELGLSGVMDVLRDPARNRISLRARRGGETRVFALAPRAEGVTPPPPGSRFDAERGVGYVSLAQFTPGVGAAVREAVVALERRGAHRLILDLRDNPGGFVTELQEVAGVFFGERPVALFVGRDPEPTELLGSGSQATRLPVVVLVDEGTASAAELLAGALRRHRHAPIVGARSFGKSLAHEVAGLSDGSALLMTSGRLLLPDGGDVLHRGVEPDVTVAGEPWVWLDASVEPCGPEDVHYRQALATPTPSG